MTQIVPRRYGLPCEGYNASRGPDTIPLTKISADSFDVLVSSIEQHVESRRGMDVLGDSPNAAARTGLLEASYSARPKGIFPFRSSSMVDGSILHGYIYGNEAISAQKGQFGWRSTNGADKNHVFGDWFGPNHYNVGSGEQPNFKMIPIPYFSKGATGATGAFGLSRCAHSLARQFTAAGSRGKPVEIGDYLAFSNAFAAPWKYQRTFNNDTTTGTDIETHAAPWGLLSPLHPPNKLAASEVAATSATDANWTYGDRYYVTVFFEDERGNFSAPFIPRPVSATVTAAKGGLITIGDGVGGAASGDTYRSVTYENIPIGPPGTRRRIIARTQKITEDNAGPIAETRELRDLDPQRLFVTGIIDNNTHTSYIDQNGQDIGLLDAPYALRRDRVWPPCGYYAAEFDERIAIAGRTRFNPCALQVGPTGAAASRDLNAPIDSATIYGSIGYFVQITRSTAGVMTLLLTEDTIGGSSPTQFSLTLTTETLQTVVDKINKSLFGDAGKEWGAQLVTGMDSRISAVNLKPTNVAVASCTGTGTAVATTESAAGTTFDDVAIGMVVRGTGIAVNPTYVTAKNSDQSLTLSQTCTSSVATLTFYDDTGDDLTLDATPIADVNYGNVRAYNGTWPVVIPLRGSFWEDWAPIDDQAVYFSVGSSSVSTLAGESFVSGFGDSAGNRRNLPARAGHIQGMGALRVGLVVAAGNAWHILENRRNTGTDQDYRLYPFAPNSGLVAWDTFVVGDDWVGGMTADGFLVADRDVAGIITTDLWRPGLDVSQSGQGRGVLSYELSQLILAAKRNDHSLDHCHAEIFGKKLHLTYRSSNLVTYPDRRIVYDFAGGAEASGAREAMLAVSPNVLAYPWSAPLRQRVSVMGSVEGAIYGAVEANDGTADGQINKLDTGGFDEGVPVTTNAYYDTGGGTVTAETPGSFLDVPVGALVTSADTGIQAGSVVTSVDADGDTLVIDLTPTADHAVTAVALTFHGKRISGLAYFAADSLESLSARKSVLRVAPLYRAVAENGRAMAAFRVSRDRDRLSSREIDLPDTGSSDRVTARIEVPYAARTPGEIVEIAMVLLTNSATAEPSLCWGMDAEVELMRLQGTGVG